MVPEGNRAFGRALLVGFVVEPHRTVGQDVEAGREDPVKLQSLSEHCYRTKTLDTLKAVGFLCFLYQSNSSHYVMYFVSHGFMYILKLN